MVGILTDIENYDRHWIFKNYFFSLKNVFGNEKIKIIKSYKDLENIKLLFIGDEHFKPNNDIWNNDLFIDFCNINQIEICILNNEKIFSSFFPWNIQIQEQVNKFNKKIQFVYDVNDSDILKCEINKTYMSKKYSEIIKLNNSEKKDKIIFIGSTNCSSYEKRKIFLNEMKQNFDIDIFESSPSLSMNDYFQTISQYKYVLSPLGNGDFVPMRYYETLFVNSIPLQQSTDKILKKFEEDINKKNSIFFTSIEDLIKKMQGFKPNSNVINYFMEDFITEKILPKIQTKIL
jgi:hypothetical protein